MTVNEDRGPDALVEGLRTLGYEVVNRGTIPPDTEGRLSDPGGEAAQSRELRRDREGCRAEIDGCYAERWRKPWRTITGCF